MEDLAGLFTSDTEGAPPDAIVRGQATYGGQEVPVFTGEFWTARQRQAHRLHEVSYRACFKPQLPAYFIKRFTVPGQVVLDPFSGRGTTAIEAALLGRVPHANDVNPLSAMLCGPRLSPPTREGIAERLGQIPKKTKAISDMDLSMFFHQETMEEILALREYLGGKIQDGTEDGVDRWIRMVATNRLTGHSPGFFSGYSLPPNQAVSARRQKLLNEKQGLVPPPRDTHGIILKKSKSLLSDLTEQDRRNLESVRERVRLFTGLSDQIEGLSDEAVDLVVTSPPFLDIVQYADDNWLRCWFNHIDAEEVDRRITQPRTVPAWVTAMGRVFRELHRVLATGGRVAFEVGEVRKGTVDLMDGVLLAAGESGLVAEAVLIHRQSFTKTANLWGVSNNAGGTNTHRVAVFRKP